MRVNDVFYKEVQTDDNVIKDILYEKFCTGRVEPFPSVCDEYGNVISPPTLPLSLSTSERIENIAKSFNVSYERMAKILEEMVRDNLSAFENGTGQARSVFPLIPAIQIFHGTNTVSLLKESIMSKDYHIFRNSMETYIVIAGAESIPFLHKVIAEREINIKNRQSFDASMQKALMKLTENNKTNDVAKITAFFNEIKQAEQPKNEKGEN
jgi:hypothetical protein